MRALLLGLTVFLNSCVALGQDDLELVDFTVATEMPDFSLEDMNNGKEHYVSTDHEGAAFLIEWYFQSCPACNQNARNVNKLKDEFKGNPKVQIIEISIDCQDSQYRQWISRHGIKGPVLNGCDRDELTDAMNVSRFPTTIIYAPNKREAMRGQGVWSGSTYNRIKRYLEQVK